MSYRDDCPSRWTAEREGERDASRQYRGYYRSPNSDHFACDDAQRVYEESYRREMRHQEERREEEEAHERHERRRAEESAMEAAAEEQAYWAAMAEEEAEREAMAEEEPGAPTEESKP